MAVLSPTDWIRVGRLNMKAARVTPSGPRGIKDIFSWRKRKAASIPVRV
jgi:hypothetical protein